MKKLLFLYYITLALLLITIGGIALSAIFGAKFDFIYLYAGIFLFVCIWCYGFIAQSKEVNFVQNVMGSVGCLKTKFRIPLSIFCTLCFLFSALGFALFMIYGGGPDFEDGVYFISSHGDFVKEITASEYEFLMIFERFFWHTAIIPVAINFLFYLKKKIKEPHYQTIELEKI